MAKAGEVAQGANSKSSAAKAREVRIPSSLSVRQLADLLQAGTIDVIKALMRGGVMANINQVVDYKMAAAVAAQLGYEAGVPITQISKLLGHATVATTQRYLNLDLDLETTISDFIPFE